MQGPWMPTPEATTFEYSLTPTSSVSPATTDTLAVSRVSNATNASLDALPSVNNVVQHSSILRFGDTTCQLCHYAMRMEGPWMPTPGATTFEYSLTPTPNVSPATTDAPTVYFF